MEGLVPQVSPAHIVCLPACVLVCVSVCARVRVCTVAAVVSSPQLARQPGLNRDTTGVNSVLLLLSLLLFSTQAKSCVSVSARVCVCVCQRLLPQSNAVSGFADTAPGSRRRTFWTRVCSQPSSRGKDVREPACNRAAAALRGHVRSIRRVLRALCSR